MTMEKPAMPIADELQRLQAELRQQLSENRSLRAELTKVRERERELEDTRRAMLLMLEDLNESTANIKRAEKEWESTFDSIKDPMFIHDREFRIIRSNKAYRDAAGLTEPEITGRPYYEIFPRMDGPFAHCAEWARTAAEGMKDGEDLVRTFPNKVYKVRYYPAFDGKGSYLFSIHVLEDITDQKQLEAQLRQAQKMEAVGQLAAGIAHDFNNILSAIVGYGYILHMKMDEDDPLRTTVEHVLESADRAASLTHSLLAFSRKQIINPADVDLNEIIQRIEKLLRRIIGEDIELKTALTTEQITVHADSGQLEQVFMNLAANARDAMRNGGCLSLETGTRELDDMFVNAHGYGKKGRYAFVSVADTGIGMDKDTQQRIFEPFFTTKDVGRGTGLGLAMVYGIVKQHEGYIDVYSEPGSGTVFKIYLPLVNREAGKSKAATLPSEREVPRGTETVLLAEDDDALRKFSSGVLSEYGYHVIEAENGEEAIDLFARHKERIKLVILDIIMPKKSGKEVYDEIRKERAGMKAIFMSGYTADRIYSQGLIEEGAELLLKPLSPKDLLIKVRETLDK